MAKKQTKSEYVMESVKRIAGSTGSYAVRVLTPEGSYGESPTSRREIASKVDAYAGRPEPHIQKAFRMYSTMLAAFPSPSASLSRLQAFAETVGFDLPPGATDASRAWEALFGETNIMEAESTGGEFSLPDPGDEGDAPEIVLGLPGEQAGKE